MAPSRGHRQHWSERQQQQQAQQQQPAQQPRQLPSDRAANNDTMDVLGDPGDPPQLTEWRRLWQLASAAYLNRQHRVDQLHCWSSWTQNALPAPLVGIYCGGLIAYIVQIRSLFLRTSVSSGVIDGFLA